MMTIPINGIRQPDLEAPDMNRSSAIDFEAATLTTFGGDASRPKLRARLARQGEAYVREQFSLKAMVEGNWRVYQQLLGAEATKQTASDGI